MARLAAVAKGLYYPSPPRVVALLLPWLSAPPRARRQTLRLLDPCCGEGAALAQLAGVLSGETYGIELQEERAAAARDRLDHALCANGLQVRLGHGAFSLLWLNPPYDDAGSEQRRMEHVFLTALARSLCPGGVLLFLIPRRRLATSARYLATHFADPRLFRFPDPEYAAFAQVVVLARKRARPITDSALQHHLETAAHDDAPLPPLPERPDGPPYALPLVPAGEIVFARGAFDAAEAAREAVRRGCLTQPSVAEELWPPAERPVRPLMPLRKGHLALLIAAGFLNNVALEQDGTTVLVKGRCRKHFADVTSENPSVAIQREVVETTVVALDLATGELTTVEGGRDGASASGAERSAA